MYLPPYFAEDDREILYSVIRENNFGVLVTTVDGAPLATHLPFLLEGDTLVAHMARANPQWEAFDSGAEVLCIFHGPHGYISPNWYVSKKAVPTWNYVAVHVYGTPSIIDDPAAALAMQERLVAEHEAGSPKPWTMDGLPDGYVEGQMRAIVNFEIPIARIEGKFKLNQNRKPEDRAGVITALRASPRAGDQELADLMEGREPESAT
ncbi:MAG: FMN-binding negative transcriptional regulator [Acidimicrobiia bacterium]|nr:FMN-binding negative transcriptional regulator [Acidimicrobiia bacterium]